MDLGLKDQVALVTASSKGLGKAAALQLAREGAHLAMCARGDELERAADSIRAETDVEVKTFTVDLLDSNQITDMVDKTLETFSN
jgi:3-oxoacyl-[acyl-carrier protein] reductase